MVPKGKKGRGDEKYVELAHREGVGGQVSTRLPFLYQSYMTDVDTSNRCVQGSSLTHYCEQPFTPPKDTHMQVHTRTQNGSVGKQLLSTFIGNYCWRSHIGRRAEFQEKKPGSYVTSAQSWQGPSNRAALRQGKLGHSLNDCLSPSRSLIHTHAARRQSQCPLLAPNGDTGETPYKKLKHWRHWDN